MSEYEELHYWIKNLSNIPQRHQRVQTLMDIAGITHLENHWSDIYAYFFNQNETHGLGRLFIDTLNNIVSEITSKQQLRLTDFEVKREVLVADENNNNKRIDLLLQNDEEAFIIENKVYARLYNRLDLYWNKPNVPEENKRGVVLSLWETRPTHKEFINITHDRFARAIENALPNYSKEALPKALVLLKDFIQNVYNVTFTMNKEELRFYFDKDNHEKINRLAEIRKNVITYIWKAIEDGSFLEPIFKENGWDLSVKTKTTNNYVYYTFEGMPDKVMLTLVYDSIWNYSTESRIRMFLEIETKEMIQFVENNKLALKDIGIESDGLKKTTTWWHFKGYEILFSIDDLVNKETIAARIVDGIKASGFYNYGMRIIKMYIKK